MYSYSIYTSAFNLIKNSFHFWRKSLPNFSQFAGKDGEVVIAVNKSEDDTLDILKSFITEYPNIKLITTDYSYDDITFDGKIKDAALQATKNPVKISMDLDETVLLSGKDKWDFYANELLNSKYQCVMLPTLDLWGAPNQIRANVPIGLKFRMHKEGLKRGVWKQAWRGDYIDTSKSDTCELLDQNDELVPCWNPVPSMDLTPIFSDNLKNYPYTLHHSFVDFQYRVNINQVLWAEKWSQRSGNKENVALSEQALKVEPTILLNLPLE